MQNISAEVEVRPPSGAFPAWLHAMFCLIFTCGLEPLALLSAGCLPRHQQRSCPQQVSGLPALLPCLLELRLRVCKLRVTRHARQTERRFPQEQSSIRMQHSQRFPACLRVGKRCSPAGASWACCRLPARAVRLHSSFWRGQAGSPPTAASAWQCPRCHPVLVGTAAPFWRAPGALHCTSAVCTCRLELQQCSCP